MYANDDDNSDSEIEIFEMSETDERSSLVSVSESPVSARKNNDTETESHHTAIESIDNDSNKIYGHTDTGSAVGSRMDSGTQTSHFIWVLSFFAAIGGFLFGYDTGVISGAMLLLQRNFNLSSIRIEIVVSVTIAFACLFALLGGLMSDWLGRKFTIIVASTVFTVGAILLSVAPNFATLVVGRSILGMGIGLASMTVPVYIAECAPSQLRGRLVTINTLFITGGQFVASLIDGAFSYDKKNGWRYMLGLAAIPSIVQSIGFIFLPESPRWLISKGRLADAQNVLGKIRGGSNVDEEFEVIKQTIDNEGARAGQTESRYNIVKVFTTPSVRRAIFVGCGLQLFQQFSGINTVMYYSATIIRMSGVADESLAIWLAAMTAGVNFAFTLVGVWLVEKIGRRVLILGSLIGVLLSLIVLAVGFQLAAYNSPPVTQDFISNTSCQSYHWCEECIGNEDCGFCYMGAGSGVNNGSCLPTTVDINTHALEGTCNTTSLPNKWHWAYQYCPTSYSWIGVFGLVLYLLFFAPGMGPMPWTINSEIYPLWARSTGNALATATNWSCNLIVSMTFLTLTETITKYGTYWLFVGIVLLGILFITIFLPETRGRKLEDTEELFSTSLCPCHKGYRKLPSETSD